MNQKVRYLSQVMQILVSPQLFLLVQELDGLEKASQCSGSYVSLIDRQEQLEEQIPKPLFLPAPGQNCLELMLSPTLVSAFFTIKLRKHFILWTFTSFSDNYYKDTCLIQAGGDALGVLSFDQIHTYSWEGRWNNASPFRVNKKF